MANYYHIALLPGHHPGKEGAAMCAGVYKGKGENAVAKLYIADIADALRDMGHRVTVTERAKAGGTSPTYSALAANATGAQFAFEFHFNSATPRASGAEVVYWAGVSRNEKIAAHLAAAMGEVSGNGLHGCGLVPVHNGQESDRGYWAFKKSAMPFFMLEPGFCGSNPQEAERFTLAIRSGAWAHDMAKGIDAALQLYGKGV